MEDWRSPLGGFWEGLGSQLRYPNGLPGRIVGLLMGLANARSNAMAVAALRNRAAGHVIELGCGPGHALRAVLRLPHSGWVAGLDWSGEMLAQASRRNRQALRAGKLHLVRSDFAALPFAGGVVDAVLAINVVYFMSGSRAVREAYRVLRPGGCIVLYGTQGSVMRRWRFACARTHRLYDRESMAALLSEAGFPSDRIRIECIDAGFGAAGFLVIAEKPAT